MQQLPIQHLVMVDCCLRKNKKAFGRYATGGFLFMDL